MSRPQEPEIFVGLRDRFCVFGHFNGNRLEIVQEGGAAEGPAADAQTAYHLRLVPDADLPELNPGAENPPPDFFTSSRKSTRPSAVKKKENFAAVKGILRRDQLHVQLVLLNFLLADVKGPLLLHLVVGQDPVVCFRSQADDPAQGRDNVPEGNLVIATGTGAVLWSPGGFDDDVVTGGNGEIAGAK